MSQTTKKLEEYPVSAARGVRACGTMLDGLEVAGQTVVVTLGITIDGTKVPLGIWLGSTENSRVCTAMLVSLRYQCVTLLGGICNLSAEIHQGGQIDALEESGTFRG